MRPEFVIETQYQIYLKRVGLSEDNMATEQKRQLRQTFMGACGQLLLLLRDDVASLPEHEAFVVMDNMLSEVKKYFLSQTNPPN